MTLPLTRNRSRSAADPVASADINDLDDMIIGARHGSKTVSVPVGAGDITAGSPSYAAARWLSSSSSDQVEVEIEIQVGSTITGIEAFVFQNGASPVTIDLRKMDNAGLHTSIATHAGNATTGAKSLPITGLSEVTVSGTKYYLRWDAANTGTDQLNSIEITTYK